VRDLAVGDVATRLDNLEPIDVAQRLARGFDRIADRVVGSGAR
jgi:hypothetical protein